MINWNDIELKGKTSGSTTALCPSCSHTRKKKTDKCLSVNIDKGAAKCHHCEDISWRDAMEDKKEYNTPPQEWRNHTSLSDKIVKYLKEQRGISQLTAISCRLTQEEYYQPSKGKKVPNIVFNYFEGDKLINKKYRSADKKFTQVKDAKKTFYGINDIVSASEAYIVEGEMDKLSFYEIGIKNCISVPNGANDLNDVFENCERYLKGIEKYYIAVDMDEAGQKLEAELIKRLGKHKCYRIKFQGKDANEDLVNGVLEKSISTKIQYPVEGTFTANDVSEQIDNLYNNGLDKPLTPKGDDWEELNSQFSVLKGQLTVVTGIPSHGKSAFIEWYVLCLIQSNELKASFYSPEHFPMELHHSVLSEKVIGKPFYHDTSESKRMTPRERDEYKKWSSDKLFLTAPEIGKPANWDWLFERFREQIFRYGVDVFVVDAFNKVKRNNSDSLGEINDVLAQVTLFCQQHNVMIFLIAHPRKMTKKEDGLYNIPSLYDVKGTGDFYDQTHNGLTVYRVFGEGGYTSVIPTKIKFKHQGQVGEDATFNYCVSNGRYFPFGKRKNFTPLMEYKEVNEQPMLKIADADWLNQDMDEPPF